MSPQSRSSANPWTYALTGALLAAAVIVAVFLLFDGSPLGNATTPTRPPDPRPGRRQRTSPPRSPPPPRPRRPARSRRRPRSPAARRRWRRSTTSATPRPARGCSGSSSRSPEPTTYARGLALLQSTPHDPDYTLGLAGGVVDGCGAGRRRHPGHHRRAGPAGDPAGHGRGDGPGRRSSRSSTRCRPRRRSGRRCSSCSTATPSTRCTACPRPSRSPTARCCEALNLMSVTSPEQGAEVSGSMDIAGRRQLVRGQRHLADHRRRRQGREGGVHHRRGLDGGEALPLVRHREPLQAPAGRLHLHPPAPTTPPAAPRATARPPTRRPSPSPDPPPSPSRRRWCAESAHMVCRVGADGRRVGARWPRPIDSHAISADSARHLRRLGGWGVRTSGGCG